MARICDGNSSSQKNALNQYPCGADSLLSVSSVEIKCRAIFTFFLRGLRQQCTPDTSARKSVISPDNLYTPAGSRTADPVDLFSSSTATDYQLYVGSLLNGRRGRSLRPRRS